MDVDELRRRDPESIELLLFHGQQPLPAGRIGPSCLSQQWAAPFTVDGERYATAEHYVMVAKARLFGDEAIAAHILSTTAPEEAVALGREVRGYLNAPWAQARFDVAVAANVAKFTQHLELRHYLVRQTGDRILAEADPNDRIWGIGLAVNDVRARRPSEWQGRNLTGFALMEVRERLRAEHA